MDKKSTVIVSFLFFGYIVFSLRGCFMDTGEKAIPIINPNPSQAVRVVANFERLPLEVDINQYQHRVIARYESRKKSCAVIKAGSGAVVWPEINVPVKGSFEEGFLVMRDYVMKDECNWKLTLISYQVKDKKKIVLSAIENAYDIKSRETQWFCKFRGHLDGSCVSAYANKSRPDFSAYGFDNTDDTTVKISIEVMK